MRESCKLGLEKRREETWSRWRLGHRPKGESHRHPPLPPPPTRAPLLDSTYATGENERRIVPSVPKGNGETCWLWEGGQRPGFVRKVSLAGYSPGRREEKEGLGLRVRRLQLPAVRSEGRSAPVEVAELRVAGSTCPWPRNRKPTSGLQPQAGLGVACLGPGGAAVPLAPSGRKIGSADR